jgi:hypothetical protein
VSDEPPLPGSVGMPAEAVRLRRSVAPGGARVPKTGAVASRGRPLWADLMRRSSGSTCWRVRGVSVTLFRR